MRESFSLVQDILLIVYADIGCFSKDTLKKNKKPNPVRNWGGPRENISRRRG